MNILISNDDGYFSPGITALAEALKTQHHVTVVAPERDRSGASHSLTLDRPLSLRKASNGYFYVNGTPTDCVHLAVTGMLDPRPDMVISGINHGANMGEDTIYSGTVAAATEGYLLGIPSLACSLVGQGGEHFDTAVRVVLTLIERIAQHPFPSPTLLNINIPDLPYDALNGTQITRLGRRHHAEPTIRTQTPRGETVYWVGPVGKAQDAGVGTDFHAVAQGYVSITPLQIDLTAHHQLEGLRGWLA